MLLSFRERHVVYVEEWSPATIIFSSNRIHRLCNIGGQAKVNTQTHIRVMKFWDADIGYSFCEHRSWWLNLSPFRHTWVYNWRGASRWRTDVPAAHRQGHSGDKPVTRPLTSAVALTLSPNQSTFAGQWQHGKNEGCTTASKQWGRNNHDMNLGYISQSFWHWLYIKTALLATYTQFFCQDSLFPSLNIAVEKLQVAQTLEERHRVCLRPEVADQVQGFIEWQVACPFETCKNNTYSLYALRVDYTVSCYLFQTSLRD